MAKVTKRENYRVEVTPDFGYISPSRITENDYKRECDRLYTEIRRHVDDADAKVFYDTVHYCEHCNNKWTEDSPTYNGGCCVADDANNPEPEITT